MLHLYNKVDWITNQESQMMSNIFQMGGMQFNLPGTNSHGEYVLEVRRDNILEDSLQKLV